MMAITDLEVSDIMEAHDETVAEKRHTWRRYRAAYEDRFWEEYNTTSGVGGITNEHMNPIQTEVNMVKPWINSYVASLFYKGIRTIARPDDVMRKKEPAVEDPVSVQLLADRFLSDSKAEALAEQAYQMGLLYGETAFKMGRSEPSELIKDQDPIDLVWLTVIPPWEALWDRRSTSDKSRYIGHVFNEPLESALSKYNIPDEIKPVAKPDVVMHGYSNDPRRDRQDESYYRILEFYDLSAVHTVGGKKTHGEFRVYIVQSDGAKSKLHKVHVGPMPYTKASGESLPPIVPVVLENTPEFPLSGISPCASIYELAAERNIVSSFLANAFRRDVARVLMFKKDEVDEDTLAAIESGQDMVLAGVEGETLEGSFKFLEQQQISRTLFDYAQMLEKNRQDISGTADFTRGTPGEYLTATEVMRLNDYTETTIGRIRKRMDKALVSLVKLYLRVLLESMRAMKKKDLKLNVRGEKFTFKRDILDNRWEITLVDTANTPIAEQQRRAEFAAVQGQLLELTNLATEGTGAMRVMAEKQLEYLVQLYDLPEDMTWATMSKEVAEDEAVTEKPELPEAPVEMIPPEQAMAEQGTISPEMAQEVIAELPNAVASATAGVA